VASDSNTKIVVVGGGAAGFFGAIAAAESSPHARVVILEKGPRTLSKVRISGGGRCNVTHSCFDPRELSQRYPRGARALIGAFHRFGPTDTVAWFESRGVRLKTEADGRMFPVTDSSQTIIDCLTSAAENSGVRVLTSTALTTFKKRPGGGFLLDLSNGERMDCERLLWAGGGCRPEGHPAVALGHSLMPPVPSLFTFQIDTPWLRDLPGISVASAQVSVPGTDLKERGPLLITHTGLSGPVVLRLSAWGARNLHDLRYEFPLRINWLPQTNRDSLIEELQARRESSGGQTILRTRWNPLPARLWESLVIQSGIMPDTKWARLSRAEALNLATLLTSTELPVRGKSTNKEEFVTCGGIPLPEVDFKTMESRIVAGLHFAGEALDIDGITGGFNFQAAWTTGWIAGHAMAGES
jgi:predicted Rossmann fold flavoprotein